MVRKDINDSWVREIFKNGIKEYTFCGALEYRYRHIAKNWNNDTRKKHDREYNNIILPALKGHNEKSIREYTKRDFEDAITLIREKGYVQNGVNMQYSEASIHNFENLIYYVVFQSAVYGLCDNVLWGSQFILDTLSEQEEQAGRVLLKKSLSIAQEKRFYGEVISDIYEDGAIVALLLMWALGLRNAEACGLNYGDIRPLEGHSDCHVAWIYKTTMIDSNELQSGGKTYNTGRIIPIPDNVVDFLNARKTILQKLISQPGKESVNLNELPICCKGPLDMEDDNYLVRCRADDITIAAHDIFESVGITSRQVAFLDAELSQDNTAAILKEKDPTAYLLRRNFATQMFILGLDYSEMQYLIGHEVEDAYESRNEYVDNERIYSMHKKLHERELLNRQNADITKKEICIPKASTLRMQICAKEPSDDIFVSLDVPDAVTSWYQGIEPKSYSRTINISKIYHTKVH